MRPFSYWVWQQMACKTQQIGLFLLAVLAPLGTQDRYRTTCGDQGGKHVPFSTFGIGFGVGLPIQPGSCIHFILTPVLLEGSFDLATSRPTWCRFGYTWLTWYPPRAAC